MTAPASVASASNKAWVVSQAIKKAEEILAQREASMTDEQRVWRQQNTAPVSYDSPRCSIELEAPLVVARSIRPYVDIPVIKW